MGKSKGVNQYTAAVILKMSPRLISWFTSYAPKFQNGRKLKFISKEGDSFYFKVKDLNDFNKFLRSPWPSKSEKERPGIPSGIEDEIKTESNFLCAICGFSSIELAHIDPVHNSKNNHPHNLISLCPNCHDAFDNKKTITKSQIKKIKADLLQTKVVIWESYSNLLDTVSLLIKEMDSLNDKHSDNEVMQKTAKLELLEEIKKNVSEKKLFDLDDKIEVERENFYRYRVSLRETLSKNGEVESELVDQRKTYISTSGKEECPLCTGFGIHNHLTCPVCIGEGTVDRKDLLEIDLSLFEQEGCPLCKGDGVHNNWECPICRGEGTVNREDFPDIDLSSFEQEECPVCEGSRVHNGLDCPVCRGVGTVDRNDLPEIDLSSFEQEECPVCEGDRIHNGLDCPVCRGIGTVDRNDLPEIDLSSFEQEECPLCEGDRIHNGLDCPVCRGVGTVDRNDLPEIDLSSFEQEDCPVCRGSRTHNGLDCPVCRGIGTVDKEDLSEIDLSLFEQEECPACNGEGISSNGWDCNVCNGVGTVDQGVLDSMELG